jgi:uncharacterized protein DUF1186/SEC-C motif-containing protein
MDAGEILDQLTHAEGLPKAALQEASAQRAEMVPVFLNEIDSYLALNSTDRAKPTPLFFIFHLLGEWREKAAYRPLARLLRCREHELNAILGDGITTTTHRVMAAVFDGDPQPLYEIILDPHAEQFIRSRMCETLAMLVLRGELDRSEVARFLRDAFMELQPQARNFVWQGWQSAIAMLGLGELKILVKRAFDRGFIDPQSLGFQDFERDLEWAVKRPGEPRHPHDNEFTLFRDTVEELSRWYAFSDDYRAARERHLQETEAELVESEPYRNPFRGVGRNDPCPCGSGKKFKKCCLGLTIV